MEVCFGERQTKPRVTGRPSPYSCDLSPTPERDGRTGKEERWMEEENDKVMVQYFVYGLLWILHER